MKLLLRGTQSILLLCYLSFIQLATSKEVEQFSDKDRHFTLKVKPVLMEKCYGCHGDPTQKIKGGFNISDREHFLKGGDEHKDTLVPGSVKKSFLINVVRWEDPDFEMPPKETDRLTEPQILDLEKWVESGAVWPSDTQQKSILEQEKTRKITEDGMLMTTSGGLNDSWTYRRYKPEDIWAFKPVNKPEMPNQLEQNPIDYFVDSSIEKEGFQPAKKADAKTLIRRAYFDLTGLPPKPEDYDKFKKEYEKDPEQAWSSLIDKLLSSKHYGERWGQHWLDVARYADTGGYSNDYERSNAWRYRDYVIRSFNEDKPYNEFIIEQIAGDELADQSLRQRLKDSKATNDAQLKGAYNESEAEKLVASSFLRMGPWDPAMVKAPQARQIYVDDVINSVGQTFLSTTMRCFKCHDHKFDPLPTRDYYRFYAAFATTQLAERPAPFLSSENKSNFHNQKGFNQELLKFATQKKIELTTKRENAAKKWFEENNLEYVNNQERKNLPDEAKPPRHVGLNHTEQGRLKVREQDEWIWNRRLERYEPMVQSVYNAQDPGFLNARKLRMKPVNPKVQQVSHILLGGALEAKGEKVTPGVLSVIGIPTDQAENDDPYKVTSELDGRRLTLAKWIAHPDNALTTRSIVNRIWQYHFGKPIAGNPNNFGVKGEKPTHPELLDWLTNDFVDNGWKIKRLHKLIMTSESYQRSHGHSQLKQLKTKDPDNDLLAYFPSRRLSAEELRDSILQITGELNPELGGLPVRPEINMEVALQPRMIQFSIAPAYQPSKTPRERNRRSIYAYRVRGLANPFLETFNQPSPNDSCEVRDSQSVTPQAFTLMNSDTMTDRSIALAQRLVKEKNNNHSDRITLGFELCFNRTPSNEELSHFEKYISRMVSYHKNVKPEKKEYPTQITRSLVEEFSGKPFEYEEILPVFREYQPDAKPWDVSPEIRAVADFCLILFNANEFIYLN